MSCRNIACAPAHSSAANSTFNTRERRFTSRHELQLRSRIAALRKSRIVCFIVKGVASKQLLLFRDF